MLLSSRTIRAHRLQQTAQSAKQRSPSPRTARQETMAARLGLRARRVALDPGPQAYLLGFSLLGPADKDRFAGAHGELPELAKPFDGGGGKHRSRRPNVRSVTQGKKS